MNIKLIISGGSKTVAALQNQAGSVAEQVIHLSVSNRGITALGWNRLYATLVVQRQHDGKTHTEAVSWAWQIMAQLSQIDGVYPESISLDDLKHLLPDLSALTASLMVDPILSDLDACGQDLGNPYTPADDPDPFYAETFFTEATRARREGRYEGWWSPIERETLPIGAPGGPGRVEPIGARPAPVEAPTIEGQWGPEIGTGNRLIYIGQDRVLDWIPDSNSSHYRVRGYDRSASGGDPLTEVLFEGDWGTITASHELIWLGRDLRNNPRSVEDLVLDWAPTNGASRLYRVDVEHGTKLDGTRDILPEPPLTTRTWTSILSTKKLIYLGGDRVLDWQPTTGAVIIWALDRGARDRSDPLPTIVTQAQWWPMPTDCQMINLGGDRVLLCVPSSGWYQVWHYDRAATGNGAPFPGQPLIEGHWPDVGADHKLVWLGGDRVLLWHPDEAGSTYRIWRYDRSVVAVSPLK